MSKHKGQQIIQLTVHYLLNYFWECAWAITVCPGVLCMNTGWNINRCWSTSVPTPQAKYLIFLFKRILRLNQVSTVGWFCHILSGKRRKIWVSRESKKLLEQRIFSAFHIYDYQEVGQPDQLRLNKDISVCSFWIQSTTWLQSHTELWSVFVGAEKNDCVCGWK